MVGTGLPKKEIFALFRGMFARKWRRFTPINLIFHRFFLQARSLPVVCCSPLSLFPFPALQFLRLFLLVSARIFSFSLPLFSFSLLIFSPVVTCFPSPYLPLSSLFPSPPTVRSAALPSYFVHSHFPYTFSFSLLSILFFLLSSVFSSYIPSCCVPLSILKLARVWYAAGVAYCFYT